MNILNYLPQLGLKPNLVNGMLFSSFASSVPAAPPLVYLLRDEFSTDAVAPLASPRTCEPGPGTLTITDTGNDISIAGGKLTLTSGAWDQTYLASAGFARLAGRALLFQTNWSVVDWMVGWDQNAVPGLMAGDAFLVQSADLAAYENLQSLLTGDSVATSTPYEFALILRSQGAFYLLKGGAYPNWTLLRVGVVGTYSPAHIGIANNTGAYTLDSLRVLDLPTPWDTDYGIATQRLAGSVSAGTTFTHEANCLIEWTQTTLNSAGNTTVHFRRQDASNYWQAAVSSTGALTLSEVVAGTPTQRATAAAGIASGHRIVIIADGTTIRGYSNNILRWTYASASNFQTATAGELNSLGTDGVVSDLISWPRVVTLPGGL